MDKSYRLLIKVLTNKADDKNTIKKAITELYGGSIENAWDYAHFKEMDDYIEYYKDDYIYLIDPFRAMDLAVELNTSVCLYAYDTQDYMYYSFNNDGSMNDGYLLTMPNPEDSFPEILKVFENHNMRNIK
ncbi:hypothetical protein F8X26_15950 [Salmonella enterica]|nr:hypothetical protein [Salmonella enterica]EDG1441079.1 hypothetical protein [Salmonella enterica subsp. enterica serovar Newport]EDT3705047.1 hypothetical protein [Salmonella enterica subsp. enterica serovar Javiana]KAB1465054.1 hypothetical protein F8B49_07425 [Salmonella enterica subsp. enterica serovar Schwarzengrund]ECU5311610.1 hypothetical protein [Salmonella enterica]